MPTIRAPTKAPLRFPNPPIIVMINAWMIMADPIPGATTRTGVPSAPPRAPSMAPKTKEEIITEKFAHLRKKPITIAEATKAYHVQRITLLGWIKLGYVGVLNRKERPMMIDEAEVAYCAKIYHERRGKRGTRLFDESGNPYQLKRPDVAEYRRRRQEAVKF